MCSYLAKSCGRAGVGAKVIVESPRAHLFAQDEQLGRGPWIRAMRHHAVEGRKALRDNGPRILVATRPDERAVTIHEDRRRAERLSVPDALSFDLRIMAERTVRWRRQTKVDRVAEVVARKTKAETDRLLARHTLHRVFAAQHCPGKRLRPRPQR
jgi:hypothetical protein